MPIDLTLMGVPDEVVEHLEEAAIANHRSLNAEIIARLATQVLPRRSTAQEHLVAIRAIRQRLTKAAYAHESIDRIKREGRS